MNKNVIQAFDISLICLCIIIVLLNGAVIAIVYHNKNIRSFTNGFVVSLALSDILTGGLFFPITIGDGSFVGLPYINCICLLLGVGNVCCVTYDRYMSISSPLTYATDIRKRFKLLVAVCWSVPILFALIPVIWSADGTTLAHKVYIYVLEICGVVIPFIFIFSVYCYIFRQVRKCNQKISREMTDKDSKRSRHKKLFAKLKVARVFVIVSILFLLSWVPILYVTTVNNLGRRDLIPDVLILLAFYALALGSIVNPVIYCFMKPDFKAAIRRIMLRRCEKAAFRASYSTRTATANVLLISNSNVNLDDSKM
ncbi:beta-1 adrenergic receptor [Nematostella vectensis]|uniref:beta-1 adrenergic receptor n=1 Tax=Nematostella vectensis TaxID=45351 RepID=UPI002076D805|nr:beta-1 adrenergic receptor [Nematostella vectensis]XP_032241286.2 beta-1 adrenergic receptor [Nematostella vectensis]XP_032241287.2 beta-1 adrenergic receptor [Nematostella vectensis]XP_032241288.2 beta-1 adrenergic receptor [Nematostella vectensis]XP_032241289.2 beta-1 adrenergic receptor [Nematostella vectensis]XP_048578951.1 beta-1 adrenergic receptor [Nematostella vectensis]